MPISRNGSTKSQHGERPEPSQAQEIYFSPIEATKSQVFLSSPHPSPPLKTAVNPQTEEDESGKPRGNREQQEFVQPPQRYLHSPAKSRLTVTPEQIDQLVTALVRAPLIQQRTSQPCRDYYFSDDVTAVSEQLLPSPASETIYALPNQQFLTSRPSLVKSTSHLLDLDAGCLALLDARAPGLPVEYLSTDCGGDTDDLRVGKSTFISVPSGANSTSTLHIRPPPNPTHPSTITLQAISSAIERRTGSTARHLVAEIDMTRSFTKAVLTELAAHADRSLDDIDVALRPPSPVDDDGTLDWCALADELQAQGEAAEAVDAVAKSFHSLAVETCAMQTLTLLAELARVMARHAEFIIVEPSARGKDGRVAKVRIPFVSHTLIEAGPYLRLDRGAHRNGADLAHGLLQEVVNAVCSRADTDEEFDVDGGNGTTTRLTCVPLFETTEEGAKAWCVFVGGHYEDTR